MAALRERLHVAEPSGPEQGALGLHPGRSRTYTDGGVPVLVYGQLDPRVAERWDLPEATFLAEIDLFYLLAHGRLRGAAQQPPRYPPALRDLAIVVDETRPYAEVELAVIEAARGVVESVALRDVYRGPQVGAGKKSFAVRVVLRSPTGTLSDEDVEKAMRRVQGRLERQLGATLRN